MLTCGKFKTLERVHGSSIVYVWTIAAKAKVKSLILFSGSLISETTSGSLIEGSSVEVEEKIYYKFLL